MSKETLESLIKKLKDSLFYYVLAILVIQIVVMRIVARIYSDEILYYKTLENVIYPVSVGDTIYYIGSALSWLLVALFIAKLVKDLFDSYRNRVIIDFLVLCVSYNLTKELILEPCSFYMHEYVLAGSFLLFSLFTNKTNK